MPRQPSASISPVVQESPAVVASCGACACGEPLPIGHDLKRRVRCRWGTAVAIAVPAQGPNGSVGVNVQFQRPIWDASEWCYQFIPREK